MKKSILAAGVAALAVITAGAALAQQAPRGPHADADRDGRVSRAEFIDGRIARLTAVDANRDGVVSVEERQSGIDTRRNQRASSRFEALDKNGDGAISREEFTAREPRADRGPRAGRGERAGRPERRGQRADLRAGRGERGPVTIADVQARLATRFDRIDTNRDGFITADERAQARQALRAERQERRAARQASRPAPASE